MPRQSKKIPYLFIRKGKKWSTHYYTRVRPAINLGRDYKNALKKYAELQAEFEEGKTPGHKKIAYAVKIYFDEIVSQKSPATQKDNAREWKMLEPVFGGDCEWDDVKPSHIKQYLRRRTGKKRANREKALFSHIWNWAREEGFTDLPNPCAGIKGNPEGGRKDVYIEDDLYTKVYNEGDYLLQDYMDMMLYTGQRNTWARMAKKTDIKIVPHPETGEPVKALFFPSQKGGKKANVIIEGDFEKAINRMIQRERRLSTIYLIADENGQPLSYNGFRSRFDKARKAAGVKFEDFQMRDIRPKTATDDPDFEEAHKRLGHTGRQMSEKYIRGRVGQVVTPGKGIKK